MSTRSIVTSQPDVSCDVCGRRLLRGEHPDVFLAGGKRRNVCELCAPRAVDEGWLRESDRHTVTLPPARQRRARNLLGRFRQLREPSPDPSGEIVSAPIIDDRAIEDYDFFDGSLDAPELGASTRPVPAVPFAAPPQVGAEQPREEAPSGGDAKVQLALDVFNASDHPRRIAGIARSLGDPTVSACPLAESGGQVTIVVAWELCWYRYQVDIGDEAAGARVVAQGTELSELDGEDRLANATVTADGRLSLVGSVLR
jgi:hypothetical protein